MAQLHNLSNSNKQTWRESKAEATRHMDGALASDTTAPMKTQCVHLAVHGDNHPLLPRSPPKQEHNHPSPPRGRRRRKKKPPRSWGIHDRGIPQLLPREIYK
ncbi:hypothetical protein QL285_073848 [Trifolium repens]|nr:hypothetical protein QL285_073848 [Trifolium repens]